MGNAFQYQGKNQEYAASDKERKYSGAFFLVKIDT